MKGKISSGKYSDQHINKNTPANLTKNEDNIPEIHSLDEFNVPKREAKTWCSYMERGFRASRNTADKQAGTGAVAPEDTHEGKICINKLQPDGIIE